MNRPPVLEARDQERRARIAESLRAEWRMIASVSLRPCADEEGFEAAVQLDPFVLQASMELQGYPRTPDALARMEARRRAALEECVRQVNTRLPEGDRIKLLRLDDDAVPSAIPRRPSPESCPR